jgi:SOS-response transcriptional repressor LexA
MELTAWETKVLEAIREISASGLPPTIGEIGEIAGLKSSKVLQLSIKSLQEKGYLRPKPKGRHRGIVLAQPLKTAA